MLTTCWFRGLQLFMPHVLESGVFLYWFLVGYQICHMLFLCLWLGLVLAKRWVIIICCSTVLLRYLTHFSSCETLDFGDIILNTAPFLSLEHITTSKTQTKQQTGLSPLAPGQWKPFLAVYAGFYVFNNIVRPLRFAASMAVSTYFDNAVAFIEKKTKLSRKLSIGVLVFLVNICGTFAAMGLGVSIASTAAGVPIFPPKA